MGKPRLAIFDFACCEGCQLQIVNLEEELLDLLALVQPVEWREAMSEQSDEYDLALLEGSLTRAEDEERARKIRARAKIVVALGACATHGGVNKLKNLLDPARVKAWVYGADAERPHLATQPTRALHEVIKVDYKVPGCPINSRELASLLRDLVRGLEPALPNHPVCVECKMREVVCRYEYNEICLGPVTRAGCGAPCPAAGSWCFGCRGLVDDPNVQAARDIMDHYGKTLDDLKTRLELFNSDHPAVRPPEQAGPPSARAGETA